MEQNINTRHAFNGLISWLSVVSGIVIVIASIYGLFLVKQYAPIVGIIWLIAIALLPTLGVSFLIIALIKYATKPHVIAITEHGTIIKQFNTTVIAPMSSQKLLTDKTTITEEKSADNTVDSTLDDTIYIPTLIEVFQDNIIPVNKLLHGHYLKDGLPYLGTWQDIRSFVIAGKSRSGKTVVVCSYIMQALLAHAVLFVNDPHFRKNTGLLRVLEPLWPYMHIGRTIEEILENAQKFIAEMEARLNGQSQDLTPWIFFTDEWSHLLRNMEKTDRDFLVKLVLNANEAYAGVNGFCCISGHEWTAKESGGSYGAAIRRGFHAVIVLRLDSEYAKFLLTGANQKLMKVTPNLRTGTGYLQDSEGDVHLLGFSYYGDNKEAICEVARMLDQNNQLSTMPAIEQLTQPNIMTTPLIQAPSMSLPETEHLEDTEELTNETEIVKIIHRLRKRGVSHRDISYAVELYGNKYTQYQNICKRHDIALN